MGVVQAVTAGVQRHTAQSFAKQYPGGATPAQLGAAAGYPGKASSALRAHVARNMGQGTKQQGITRYPKLSYAQWCALLKVAERTAQAQPGSKPQAQAQAQASKVWAAARRGARQGKGTAKQGKQGKQAPAKAQASKAPAVDATAQAAMLADAKALAASMAELAAQGQRMPLNAAGQALVAAYPQVFASLPAGALAQG